MDFRFATQDDVELLAKLRIEMRKERETVRLAVSEEEFLRANIDYFREFIGNGHYCGIIVEENGEVAATGGMCFHNHPPSYSIPNGKSAYLLNVYTLPAFRHRGIAGKIVEILVEEAEKKGCCKAYLNASKMGKSVYQKFGFEDVENEMVFDIKH